jgi:hypothetical protein
MPTNTAERARQSDLRLALELYLASLGSDGGPMRQLIASPAIEDKLAAFDRADQVAIDAQGFYRRFCRFALRAMLIGAVMGGIVLLPIELFAREWPRRIIGAVQALALVASFIAVMWLGRRQSVGLWMHARAQAEALRADVFRAIVRAGVDAKDLLPQVLACFKAAHLDWQLGYFRKRGGEHMKSAGRGTPFRLTAYVLTTASVLLACTGLLAVAGDFGILWEPLKDVAPHLQVKDAGRWQLGLGALASSVLAFASARTFLDQDERNAACYAATADQLDELVRTELADAEAAARAGQALPVLAVCEKVQSVLSAEHMAWSHARPRRERVGVPGQRI